VRQYLIIASKSLVSDTGMFLIRTHVATGSIASYKTKPSISGCSSQPGTHGRMSGRDNS